MMPNINCLTRRFLTVVISPGIAILCSLAAFADERVPHNSGLTPTPNGKGSGSSSQIQIRYLQHDQALVLHRYSSVDGGAVTNVIAGPTSRWTRAPHPPTGGSIELLRSDAS